jgi:CDP-diacylglycerol--glycerol-3-phosphate 3-phosphatidyltransferase
MGRIASIPLVLYFIDNYSPVRSFIATIIYIGAALTDSLDGYLARRNKQVSVLGKFLDPLADKLIVTAVLVYLVAMDRCPAWLAVALLARELAVTGLRSIAVSEGLVISASDSGKQKTALQLVGTLFLLIHFKYPVWGLERVTFRDEPLLINYHAVGISTLYLALAMSWISALDYFLRFVRAVQAAGTPTPTPPPLTTPAPAPPSKAPDDPGPGTAPPA